MKSGWIWIPGWQRKEEKEAFVVYFRKCSIFEEVPDSFRIRISADSRYKLYINGQFCEAGPSKGDDKVWFYDEVETAPFLKQGLNIWAVIILRYPLDPEKGNMSIFRTESPGLYLESIEKDPVTGESVLSANGEWKVKRLRNIHIVSENPFFAPLQIYEQAEGAAELAGWMEEGYDDRGWPDAVEYKEAEIAVHLKREHLAARTIPFMKKVPGEFRCVSRAVSEMPEKEAWEQFLRGTRRLVLTPYSKYCVEIDAGELMTGYLRMKVSGGAGAVLKFLQAECYVQTLPDPPKSYQDLPLKKDRTDCERGLLAGFEDIYQVCGYGTADAPEMYEPFWFRTFRFIRLTIETKGEALILEEFDFLETGYPLEIKSAVQTSDSSMEKIWEISARSLQRCMHETYEDCPFYEQLQYAMDSRSEILFTYAVSADDRLARKCMDDFRRSQRADGLLNCSYPNVAANVIPGFSIYYIGMVYDHMMYFGDRELVEKHMPVIDRILEYFHSHLDKRGIVGKVGDRNRAGQNWSFIDWTAQWDATDGVPDAALSGPVTMESFLYLIGLQYAEKLCDYLGQEKMASAYHRRAEHLKNAVNTFCRGNDGMYQDGPGIEKYSQHCQVFAVLTGIVTEDEGRTFLLKTLERKKDYAQCSVAMMYYLFRALEKCGLYEKTGELWDIWKDMLKNHLTTCAEDPIMSRSDCHAWGALALYELPSVILGVRPAAPGYEKIDISPVPGPFTQASGRVITPKGTVCVKWWKEEDEIEKEIRFEPL